MRSVKPLVILSLLFCASLPILALCAQASPYNCPAYVAVACHPDGDERVLDVQGNYALAEVRQHGRVLDWQSIHCNETGRFDPYLIDDSEPTDGAP